ncbi:hypothetical protein BH10PAT1_BH10PAT1_4460 [soil metagenome]
MKQMNNFKKYLPFIAIIVVAVILVGGVMVIRKINQPVVNDNLSQDENIPDLPVDQRPTAALVPTSDGYYLNLNVDGIKVPSATSMDYELTYKADNNGTPTTQGVPGTIQLNGATSETRKLLLGSESSGKFRYDKGVENGMLTLRFRDASGKMLGKVSTDWHLQTNTLNLTSVDGSFKYTLTKAATGVWFVTMQPFGTPDTSKVVVFSNGWAIYASDGLPHTGK